MHIWKQSKWSFKFWKQIEVRGKLPECNFSTSLLWYSLISNERQQNLEEASGSFQLKLASSVEILLHAIPHCHPGDSATQVSLAVFTSEYTTCLILGHKHLAMSCTSAFKMACGYSKLQCRDIQIIKQINVVSLSFSLFLTSCSSTVDHFYHFNGTHVNNFSHPLPNPNFCSSQGSVPIQ